MELENEIPIFADFMNEAENRSLETPEVADSFTQWSEIWLWEVLPVSNRTSNTANDLTISLILFLFQSCRMQNSRCGCFSKHSAFPWVLKSRDFKTGWLKSTAVSTSCVTIQLYTLCCSDIWIPALGLRNPGAVGACGEISGASSHQEPLWCFAATPALQ